MKVHRGAKKEQIPRLRLVMTNREKEHISRVSEAEPRGMTNKKENAGRSRLAVTTE